MKLLLIGWFHLINPVITAKNYFEILGYDVFFLPLLSYRQKFIGEKLYSALNSFIKNIDPNVILWWNWECEREIIFKLKTNFDNAVHCLFNWDHPFCLSDWELKHNRKITQQNIWDICFVTGDCKLEKYLESGSKEAYYLRMFADEEIHFPDEDDKYKCDVSIVCTQLYEDKRKFKDQIFDRKSFIQNIIDSNINIKVYGPEHLKTVFPNNYCGFAHFLENHKVFYNSKINICTHVTDGNKYCNERVGTILSSGGLLFCDRIKSIDKILTDGHDCILLDKDNYINQIKKILSNYDKYKYIKENAIITAKKKFSPKKWSGFIHEKVQNFIRNNPTKGKSLRDNIYDFKNYQKGKISIIMTYYNRLAQLIRTLNSIEESSYPKELIEVICYDDRSEKEQCLLDLSTYSYNIKIIYGEF